MARLLGPDLNGRMAYVASGAFLLSASGRTVTVYTDAGGTTLASIATYNGTNTPGAVITGSTVTVDAYSMIPRFWFPDGVDTVYVKIGSGPVTAVNADYDARFDTALPLTGGTITGDLTVTGNATLSGFPAPMPSPNRRPAWRRPSFSQQFQTGHGWTTSGPASSNLNDTSQFVRGTQSVSMTTTGTGTAASLSKLAGSALDLTGKAIRVIFRCTNVAKISSVNFFAGTSSLASNFKWRLNPVTASNGFITEGEWVTATFGWAEVSTATGYTISASGVPSVKSGFTDLRFQVIDDATGPVTTYVQAIEVVPDVATTFPNGLVSITFDDSHQSVYDYARPKMDALGYAGTQYTIVSQLGTAGRFTVNELTQLQNLSGWEVGLHAYDGTMHTNRYTTYTAAQVAADFRNGRAWASQNGFRGDSFAYPGGDFGPTTDAVMVDQIAARYFTTARSILATNGSWPSGTFAAESFPPAMPHRLRSMSSISSTSAGAANPTAMVAAGGTLDKVVQGTWLIMCFHSIVTGAAASATEISQTDFNTLMDGLAARNITVLPVGDAMSYYA